MGEDIMRCHGVIDVGIVVTKVTAGSDPNLVKCIHELRSFSTAGFYPRLFFVETFTYPEYYRKSEIYFSAVKDHQPVIIGLHEKLHYSLIYHCRYFAWLLVPDCVALVAEKYLWPLLLSIASI